MPTTDEQEKAWARAGHIDRPYEDALTLGEVAQAIGVSYRWVRYLLANGKLRGFRIAGGDGSGLVKLWVRRNALKTYIRDQVERQPELAVRYAETGMLK